MGKDYDKEEKKSEDKELEGVRRCEGTAKKKGQVIQKFSAI